MPHPYKPKGKPKFGPDALLERPELSAYIGAVATAWTAIEELWGMILAQMLDSDAKAGIELYLALPGDAAQMAVVRKTADARLPEHLKLEFAKLLKEEKGRARERNTIVHGRWAIDPEEPNGLLLAERDWLPRSTADVLHHYKRLAGNPFRFIPYKGAKAEFLIYRERDFKATLKRLGDFSYAQTSLGIRISSLRITEAPPLEPPPRPAPSRGLLGSTYRANREGRE